MTESLTSTRRSRRSTPGGNPFPPIAEFGFLSDCEVAALKTSFAALRIFERPYVYTYTFASAGFASGQMAVSNRPTARPMDISMKRWSATIQGLCVCAINITMISVMPA